MQNKILAVRRCKINLFSIQNTLTLCVNVQNGNYSKNKTKFLSARLIIISEKSKILFTTEMEEDERMCMEGFS